MNEKINWKSIVAGLIVLIGGVGFILWDIYKAHTPTNLWISIGCSLIASALVIILTDLLVDRVKDNPLDVWGIKKIYQSRSKMNEDCAISLKRAKYKVDVVAFGLKSYRDDNEKLTKTLLQKGVNFRIITMHPDSPYVTQREIEENETSGQIKNTIEQLVSWADGLNRKGYEGKIVVRGYSCMTLDFYWRADNDVYVGPYWYGLGSQRTISYKFEDGKGFEMYSDYFDKLWNNSELLTALTQKTKI